MINPVLKKDFEELFKEKFDRTKLAKASIMIFGANSMIGCYLTWFLNEVNEKENLNMNIIALVRNYDKAMILFRDYVNSNNFEIVKQDVLDEIKYDEKVDYIIHAAGSASPHFIINDPVGIIKANTTGTSNILDFAVKKSVKNVLFTSTREVYGKPDDSVTEITEEDTGVTDQLLPRSCYPESKRIAESLFVSYAQQFELPYTILRIAHSYGPAMTIANDGRVMSDFINSVVNDEDIVLNSDGSAIRAFCYVSDTIKAMLLTMLSEKKNEVYNLANETDPRPIREVAQSLVSLYPEKKLTVKVNGLDESIRNKGYNSIPVVPMSTKKLESLGWKPKVGLEDGMKRTVDYFLFEKENN